MKKDKKRDIEFSFDFGGAEAGDDSFIDKVIAGLPKVGRKEVKLLIPFGGQASAYFLFKANTDLNYDLVEANYSVSGSMPKISQKLKFKVESPQKAQFALQARLKKLLKTGKIEIRTGIHTGRWSVKVELNQLEGLDLLQFRIKTIRRTVRMWKTEDLKPLMKIKGNWVDSDLLT